MELTEQPKNNGLIFIDFQKSKILLGFQKSHARTTGFASSVCSVVVPTDLKKSFIDISWLFCGHFMVVLLVPQSFLGGSASSAVIPWSFR